MSDRNEDARRAIRKLYQGTPEPGWSAEFHGETRAVRLRIRAELMQPDFQVPLCGSKDASNEMRARWLLALDVCDLLSDPPATVGARSEAAAILRRVSHGAKR